MEKREIAEMNRKAEMEKIAKTSDYYGNVGDKFKGNPITVILEKTFSFETQFGTTYVWNMRDEVGHTFVWFTNGNIYWNIEQLRYANRDDENLVKHYREIEDTLDNNGVVKFEIVGGSIKEHKDYTDRLGVTTKQTILTRCKIDNIRLCK